jgi:hypothetical protein
MRTKAEYLKRPENMAKGKTAENDFGFNGTEVFSLGTTSARNVDKWTGIFSVNLCTESR